MNQIQTAFVFSIILFTFSRFYSIFVLIDALYANVIVVCVRFLCRRAGVAVVVVAFLRLAVLSIKRRANVVKRRSTVGGFRPRRQHDVVVAEIVYDDLLVSCC